MIRKIAALALAFALTLSMLTVSAESAQYQYEYIKAVAEFLIENGYYVDYDADPLADALVDLLENYPEVFDLLLSYMLDGFDERTMYLPSDSAGAVLQTSNYIGIGVTISLIDPEINLMEVTGLHESGGAKRAGMQIGDIVTAVNGTPVSEMEFLEVSEVMRDGDDGSFVEVSVERGEQAMTLSVERSYLGEPDYSASELENGVWLMRWTRFRNEELMKDYYATLEEMENSGAKALIIDLRGNGGGYIDMAFEIVESLIPDEGVHYLDVSWREGSKSFTEQMISEGVGLELEQIVILCDEGTASASEIIMAALCDTGYAVGVGSRTYGKATAQYEIETFSGSLLIITALKMNSINGDYDHNGLYPYYSITNAEKTLPPTSLRLREAALSFGNCSDDAVRLNEALVLLDLMRAPDKSYRLGESTQAAVNNLRQNAGLPVIEGIDLETILLINDKLENLSDRTVTDDLQFAKALELCRESVSSN